MYHVKLGGILFLHLAYNQNGGNERKLVIYGSEQEFEAFKDYLKKYKKELEERNVQIVYKDSKKFKIELYGYDGEFKKSIDKQNLQIILEEIDQMPMGKIEKMLRYKNFI